MTTPIFDYINKYQQSNPTRLHMPGHKGVATRLGVEQFDITEIEGADELYAADGIIAQSEKNASDLFGAHTYYSTEGSSLSIRAMLFLLVKWCRKEGKQPYILAARNVHKTFINTVALLDIKVDWLMGRQQDSFEECRISPEQLQAKLDAMNPKPSAVYITSPDYLGNVADIKGLAQICHDNNILLLVDNAHGAYLRFINPSQHPMDLGADMCADSAHKTLPVLTGGAYLHISHKTDSFFMENAKYALEMFGSTSPSYLIMASLDLANEYMETMSQRLMEFAPIVAGVKTRLKTLGYKLIGDELLKISIECDGNGQEIATKLIEENIYPEYIDDNHIVLMLTSENSDGDLKKLVCVLEEIAGEVVVRDERATRQSAINLSDNAQAANQQMQAPLQLVSAHDAIYADFEELPAQKCAGRILAAANVSCPPAVPVYMMGERIGEEVADPDSEVGRLLKNKKLKVVK